MGLCYGSGYRADRLPHTHALPKSSRADISAVSQLIKWSPIDLFVLFLNNLQHTSFISGADNLLMVIDSCGNTTAIN